jgi:alpha-D-xyloside xylohydrolase
MSPLALVLALMAAGPARADGDEPFALTPRGVVVPVPGGRLRLSVPQPSVVHVEASATERFSERESLVVVPQPALQPVQVARKGRTLRLSADGLLVRVDLASGGLAFGDGTPFLQATQRVLQPVEIAGDSGFALKQAFDAPADQGFHGLGTYQDGTADWRGHSVLLAQANTMSALPVLVSSLGWGLLWDNASHTVFQDDRRSFSFESTLGDQLDYYVLATRRIDDAIVAYRRLTGRAPLFGRWAYGYWQSKERYQSADELLAVVGEYRARRLPIDDVVLDWNWWPSDRQWSAMVWDQTRFPDPAGLLRRLHDLHARLMVSIWPAVGLDSQLYRELRELGATFPGEHWAPARVYDAWNDAARALYWRRAKEALLDNGVDGFWMDATEPEFRSSDDRYMTEEMVTANGRCAAGSLARNLNSYSLVDTRGAWEMQRASAPGRRVFLLTRSSFAGQQRHAAVLWSGDIHASWKVFRNQVAAGLHYALGGMPYWTTDIGAFFIQHRYPRLLEDPAYRELYVRWFQYGAFSPIFRAHGTQAPREIWRFGEPGSPEYEALAAADRLRYRLLPYLYSLAGRVTLEDGTILRPLVMDFAGDARARGRFDQYLFGPALLVSPVTKALVHRTPKVEEAIPTDHLFDADGRTPGLRVAFFRGASFEEHVADRRSEVLSQTWDGTLPGTLVGSAYSARWEGRLLTNRAGRYRFVVTTDGGVRLRLADHMLVDVPDNAEAASFSGELDLPADAKLPLWIEHRQPRVKHANLVVEWEYPGLAEETWSADGRFARWLPAGTEWTDFWTGRRLAGGRELTSRVPLDRVPLDVRAGSIVPLGPDLQWTDEKPADPLELRVYPGADGAFVLYEDEGDGYGYENGAFATIPLRWDDARRTLTIGARQGRFPGMLEQRRFRVVVVRPGHGVGIAPAPADREVGYDGRKTTVRLAGGRR